VLVLHIKVLVLVSVLDKQVLNKSLVSCKVHPEGESAPLRGEESYFYWAEKVAAFNLGYFIDFRRLTTIKGRQHFRQQQSAFPANKSWLRLCPWTSCNQNRAN